MKKGKSLLELMQVVEAHQQAKKDFIVPTSALSMQSDNTLLFGGSVVKPTNLAHRQIAEHVGIPQKYYDRMRDEAPELLSNNVNNWFKQNPAVRMVRTLGEECRAVLSDRFRPMENIDLLGAVVPVLMDIGVEVLSADITDTKLYIKAVDERIKRDIPTGKAMGDGGHTIFDTLCPAIVISNSEVGLGRLMVQTSVFTRACTNLATFGESSLKKHHVGGRNEFADASYEMMSSKTKELTDAALWAQAGDVVKGAFAQARFDAICNKMAGSVADKVVDAIQVVELASTRFGVNEEEKAAVLRRMIEGADMSRYGLFNAFTRTAEDLPSYDRASEFERFGGQIIEMERNEWQVLAKAA